MITPRELAKTIDYSLLKADVTPAEIEEACKQAKKWGFNSVCLNPCYIGLASKLLKGSGVKVTAVLAYPLGATPSEIKTIEAKRYVKAGADELDMVMNLGEFKAGNYRFVEDDIKGVVTAARLVGKKLGKRITVKVIIETGLLTNEEIGLASKLVKRTGADFVKSGTGWGEPATPHDVRLIRKAVGKQFGIKAAGGIRNAEQVFELLKAGATRIGTSAALEIMRELEG